MTQWIATAVLKDLLAATSMKSILVTVDGFTDFEVDSSLHSERDANDGELFVADAAGV